MVFRELSGMNAWDGAIRGTGHFRSSKDCLRVSLPKGEFTFFGLKSWGFVRSSDESTVQAGHSYSDFGNFST